MLTANAIQARHRKVAGFSISTSKGKSMRLYSLRSIIGKPYIECDEIIPQARLRLNPKVKLCVGGQSAKEGRLQRSRDRALMVARNQDTVIVRG
jgi:hypothetical protein